MVSNQRLATQGRPLGRERMAAAALNERISGIEIGLNLPPNIFTCLVADDLNFLGRSGAITHHDHRLGAGVLQLIERPS